MCKNETENDKKETGKCKKARLRIEHAINQVKHLTCQMEKAHDTLKDIVDDVCENDHKESEDTLLTDCQRIVFKHEGLPIKFYIDFRLVVEEDDLHGAIIYGARRTPRYPYILQAKASEVLKAAPEKEVSPLAWIPTVEGWPNAH